MHERPRRDLRRAQAAAVLDRLPDDRQRQRGRGHRPGGVPPLPRAEADGAKIESPKAYLSAVTTRLCIDHLSSARVRREQYVGQWLPEPLLTDADAGRGRSTRRPPTRSRWRSSCCWRASRRSSAPSSCSTTSSTTGTTRSPTSSARARTTAASSRCARGATWTRGGRGSRPRGSERERARRPLLRRVGRTATPTASSGCWPHDVVVYGDGGREGPAWRRPIYGRESVSRLLLGLGQQLIRSAPRSAARRSTASRARCSSTARDSSSPSCRSTSRTARVQTIRSIANPDKLAHLGPVADLRALLREIHAP